MKLKANLILIFAAALFCMPVPSFAQSLSIESDTIEWGAGGLIKWDFGEVEVGNSVSQTVVLSSADINAPLTIHSVLIYELGDSGWILSSDPFDILNCNPYPIPSELYAGEKTVTVQVGFSPLSIGLFDDFKFTIHSNDHLEEFTEIMLTGRGIFKSTTVPEPSAIVLLGIGLVAFSGALRRRPNKQKS
ncbi:MAG: PEP-CTERM sorting domain-containing protein [Pseudomonadota bacterium]